MLGVPVQRTWQDILTIDAFLEAECPTLIVELGTGSGGFSAYLAMYCFMHGGQFHTFDTVNAHHVEQKPHPGAMETIAFLGGTVHRKNVFDPATVELVASYIEGTRAFVYCDNGNKPREVATYAPLLKKGDFLGVHDYGTEITEFGLEGFSFWRPEIFKDSSNRILECER